MGIWNLKLSWIFHQKIGVSNIKYLFSLPAILWIVPSSSTEVFQRTEMGVVLSALSIAFLPLKCRGKKRGPSDSTFKDQAIKNLDHFSFHPTPLHSFSRPPSCRIISWRRRLSDPRWPWVRTSGHYRPEGNHFVLFRVEGVWLLLE